jgi:glycosyltransferase involved in cell wall biosynthesis
MDSAFNQPRDILSSIYSSVEPIRLEISKMPQSSWKVPFRKIYYFGKKFLRPIAQEDIDRADIFHSPVHAIPAQLQEAGNILKFITIHDLIPFICPEYCHSSSADYMKTIVDSIKPDTNVICVSNATKNDLFTFMPFLDPDKVSVVCLAAGDHFYRCCDLNRISQTRIKYNIPPESDYLLALSTLQPRKNFERIIRSFVELVKAEHVKDLNLVLVGADGWDYKKIYDEIKGAGELSNKIILTGYVPDEDLAPLYSGAMVFLYPSLYEGFGLPPLEAMQCGTPVITSNNSSLPEVAGHAAIMIDPRDGDGLCQSMLNLYKSHDLREKLSAASIERAKRFSWDKTTRETIDAYRRAFSYN